MDGGLAGDGAHGDHVCVAHDGVGEGEGEDNLDLLRGHVGIHGDVLRGAEEAEVALGRP